MLTAISNSTVKGFSGYNWLMKVAGKARKNRMSARKILDRQSALRRNLGIETCYATVYHAKTEPRIEKFGEGCWTRYYAVGEHAGEKIAAYGTTPKDAYKAYNSFVRGFDRSEHNIINRMDDWRNYEDDSLIAALNSNYDLMTSDILAPKKGRLVN